MREYTISYFLSAAIAIVTSLALTTISLTMGPPSMPQAWYASSADDTMVISAAEAATERDPSASEHEIPERLVDWSNFTQSEEEHEHSRDAGKANLTASTSNIFTSAPLRKVSTDSELLDQHFGSVPLRPPKFA